MCINEEGLSLTSLIIANDQRIFEYNVSSSIGQTPTGHANVL